MRVRGDVRIAFGSAKGPVREDNQDDYVVYEPEDDARFAVDGRLLAVADGMGGGPAGGEASRLALRALLSSWLNTDGDDTDVTARLTAAFECACDSIEREAKRDRTLAGMGTTLTAANVIGHRLYGVHVGDSACFLLRAGRLDRLTELHHAGLDEHRLTKAVGVGKRRPKPDTFSADLLPGDRVLWVTDGLWPAVPEHELVAMIRATVAQEAVEDLLTRAQQLSGQDNATVVLLELLEAPGEDATVEPVEAEAATAWPRPVPKQGWLAIAWPWLLLAVGAGLGIAAVT
ncbi:MAG: protein phosphatase 2C domain-containing protein [Planctomycetota bacterium]|nr:protein phosphatase 2C domain-containing protein [Planctomycetota bacterium]